MDHSDVDVDPATHDASNPSRRPRKPGARRWGKTISLQTMCRETRPLSDEESLTLLVHERPTNRVDCRPEGVYRDAATGLIGHSPAGRLRIWNDRAGEACPWVGCRHHLALSISPSHGIKELVDWQSDGQPVCALDIADDAETTLDRTGHLEGITRERVRQIEVRALGKMRAAGIDLRHREIPADDER